MKPVFVTLRLLVDRACSDGTTIPQGAIMKCSKMEAKRLVKGNYAEYVSEEQQSTKETKKTEIKPVKAALTPKQLLQKEKNEQELKSYNPNTINWINDDFFDSYDKIKGHCKILWGHKQPVVNNTNPLFFLAHSKDTITGKPQLVSNVQKRIPLVRCAIKKLKDQETKEEVEIQSFYFFDEKFDRRYDGYQTNALACDFWLYRVINEEGMEFYIHSQQQLPNEVCQFSGMIVELSDFSELSRSLRLPSLSRIFFMKEFVAHVQIVKPEELIAYTKGSNLTEVDWFNFLAYHPFGKFNRFPEVTELLRSVFLLSGKVDGYPMHLIILGPAGTKKTMGHIETIAFKFSEQAVICEGANSRIKALSPSFKEKPANIGYIAKAARVGFIDEIGKMVEFEITKGHNPVSNCLGELNFLLEHKRREVGSGNDNNVEVQATAKILFTSNAVSGKHNLSLHIGLFDPTTMSRILWAVQDKAEQEFLLSKNSIEEFPRTLTQDLPKTAGNPANTITSVIDLDRLLLYRKIEKKDYARKCVRGISIFINREKFLTIYDTCNSFICQINDDKVEEIAANITKLVKEPIKSSVWKPRAIHHTKLIIDGVCKHRCLFKDYDPSFTANDQDYATAQRILSHIANSWETDLSPRERREGVNAYS